MATTQWMRVPMNCYFDIVDMCFEAIKYTYTYILMTVSQTFHLSELEIIFYYRYRLNGES
jgi:hypothetical protein